MKIQPTTPFFPPVARLPTEYVSLTFKNSFPIVMLLEQLCTPTLNVCGVPFAWYHLLED